MASDFRCSFKFSFFPREKLSVQVHPDDAQALRVGQPWGKTECWYVAHLKRGSQFALGLKPGVTVSGRIHSPTIARRRFLHWINIYGGEMTHVAGGTVHTLAPRYRSS